MGSSQKPAGKNPTGGHENWRAGGRAGGQSFKAGGALWAGVAGAVAVGGVAMSVLGNYVRLEPGRPKRLHLVSHQFVEKIIRDPLIADAKSVRVLQFRVDREDGQKVDKVFSVTSEKLAQAFLPYLDGQRYRFYEVEIIKTGEGFLTDYTVRFIPL